MEITVAIFFSKSDYLEGRKGEALVCSHEKPVVV